MQDFVDTLPQAAFDLADHPGVEDGIDPAPRRAARWCACLGRSVAAPARDAPSRARQQGAGGAAR